MRFRYKADDRPERRTVLVIDEDAGLREVVGALLEDEGYAVATCDRILGARASIRAVGPDPIILDPWDGAADRRDVPDGAGAELASARVPWIVYSTDSAALGRRPSPGLAKPFDAEVLLALVGRLIGVDEDGATGREAPRPRDEAGRTRYWG